MAMARDWATNKLPEDIVLSSAYWIAKMARDTTPRVSVSKIDTALGLLVSPVRGKSGRLLSMKQAKNRMYSGHATVVTLRKRGGKNQFRPAPLAAMIVQASVWPGMTGVPMKAYNKLTNMRWQRDRSPFATGKGSGREAGRAAMRMAIDRMLKARHSSTVFLASGWGVVAKRLLGMFKGSKPPSFGEGVMQKGRLKESFGAVTVLSTGTKYAMRIENMIGMLPGKKGANAANYNRALHEHGGPALQAAVDARGAELVARYWPREQAAFEKRWRAAVG